MAVTQWAAAVVAVAGAAMVRSRWPGVVGTKRTAGDQSVDLAGIVHRKGLLRAGRQLAGEQHSLWADHKLGAAV